MLPSGDVVHPEGPYISPPSKVEPGPSGLSPSTFRAEGRRNLNELSAGKGLLNGVCAVFGYTILGIGDAEICEILKITPDQLSKLRQHEAYSELFNSAVNEIIGGNSQLVQGRIAAGAIVAAKNVVHLASNAKNEGVKLSANKDILDRSGVTADDLRKSQQSSANELRVVIEDRRGGSSEINIQMNGEDIEVI